MKTLISRNTKSDIYANAVNIRYKVFVEEQNVPIQLEIDEHETDCIYFVLYNNAKIAVATARLLSNNKKNYSITLQRMAVLKEYRGQKYGYKLIENIEKYAKKQHYSEIELHAQLTALPFYLKMQYFPFGDEFEEAGIKHVCMKKSII